jgi:hypothetical protein
LEWKNDLQYSNLAPVMNRKFDADEILKQFKNSHGKNEGFIRFSDRTKLFEEVLLPIHRLFGEDDPKTILVKSNYITNVITEFEVFLKSLVKMRIWPNEDGYNKLLNEARLNMNEAYHLLRNEKITREFIISSYYSFQNLSSMNYVFSQLIGKDFLDAIDSYTPSDETKPLIASQTTWRSRIEVLFRARNEIVHEGKETTMKSNELVRDALTLNVVGLFITLYVAGHTDENKAYYVPK